MRGPFLSIGLGAAVVLATSGARADSVPASERGFSVGLRVGYSFPLGALAKDDALHSNVTGLVPVWFDAGYRVSRAFTIGPYFQWGPAFVSGDVCPKNLSCSAYDIRAGLNAQLHLKWLIDRSAPGGHFDPWVGIGTGYETTTTYVSTSSGAKSHETNDGFEFGNVQLGADYVGNTLHLGVFAVISLAEFVHRTETSGTGSSSFAIPEPRLHGWFSLGVRGQYDL